MKPHLRLALATGCVALSGCANMQTATAEPAMLTESSPQSREELSRIVGQALNRPPVLLADDALLHEDVLIVERRQHRDSKGLLLNGRETEAPQHFRLVKHGTDCILLHDGSERRWHLKQGCTALPAHR